MAALDTASDQDVKRLLELFPSVNLRKAWPGIKGSKEELCFAVAQQLRNEVIDFVDETFSCCKQHVYVLDQKPDEPVGAPAEVAGAQAAKVVPNSHSLYVVRVKHRVVLRDPLEETSIDFLWPVRVEASAQHLVIRFVTLEKNLGSYFDRPYYVGDRDVDEKDIVPPMTNGLVPADLHKGVKKLWGDGFMDSHRTSFKKPTSRASEAMDEERGIRENNPELYALLQDTPLYNTIFTVPPEKDSTVSVFSVDPTRGYIAFPRYSDTVGDTDFVIREILKNNQ
jgi:hypothetical protein